MLQPFGDVLAHLDPACRDPPVHLGGESVEFVIVIAAHETFHHDPLRDQREKQFGYTVVVRSRVGAVVARHQAADGYAGASVEQRPHGVEHRPADVLEIDVDAPGYSGLQVARERRLPVVDTGVEPERLHHVAALLRAARDPHDAASFQLGDLTDNRSHRAAGGPNDEGLAGLWLADRQQAVPRGQAGRTEYAERV